MSTITMSDTSNQTKTRPLSRRQPMSRLLPDGSAGAVTHWLPTRWPRIGGYALAQIPVDAFLAPNFRDAYVPGTLTSIYAAGCGFDSTNTAATGLVGVARRLLAAVHKISTTTQTDLRSRLRELNRDRYAALTTSADGYPCNDLGFDSWMMQHVLPSVKPLVASPVAIGDRCLSVRLPHDLPSREFDKQLGRRMKNAQLNRWLKSAAGEEHCRRLKLKPLELARGTTYGFSGSMRRSDADEIYFFRPKSTDADRLLRLAEAIVYDHVTTRPALRVRTSWQSRSQGTRSDFRPAT